MRSISLLARAAVALAPLSYAGAQTATKNLTMDFRTTVTVSGMPDTSIIQGRAIGSRDKMRMDLTLKGPGAQVSPLGANAGKIIMILSDSGKTVTYLDSTNGRYLRVRPADMLAQAQQSGQMSMKFSDTQATVDSLGAGPSILGHSTSHYRVGTGMTMTISAMGQEQTVKISSTADYYYANDIKAVVNPFASLTGSDMSAMFGSANKDFADKLKIVQQKLPKGTPLRASTTATMIAQGQTRVTNTQAEVTSVQWVDAKPGIFDVPAGYTSVALPGMPGSSSSAIPPK
ncbi:MAG TPA: hypothetical protein VGG76_10210 [Gemmatimonadaceae bacterium]|jgi:hypothetical protein